MVTTPQHQGIAIIGLSCRAPGAASAAEFWKNLCEGTESITFFSDAELAAAGVDPALLANPNYVKAAPMLRDVETFDAAFFGYSPKDAALMDPQQRLFLEVCWEAFEDAGYDPAVYPGKVGVLSAAGGVVSSYLLAKLQHEELPGQTASIAHINNDKDFLSTRVAFKLNLTGPSFTIQSACSSSLVAVHQACQTLSIDECDMMLVGGSVVRVPQVEGYLAEKRNLHSLDGHCRPFDAVGQGTIFGSGVGAVLLKPLDRALRDRDHIYAVIKGAAANNDGSSKTSYTAPSLGQQAQAVADALARGGVHPDSVGYLECHSTGTIVGDPLEIEALSMAFRKNTERRQFCAIGSVKANIGHPEQAAGIIGLIKTALVLHHKQIPPSINFDTPNPAIDFAGSPFYVNTALSDFAAADTPRRAGLNSLGIGGTNVFVILEEAPQGSPEGAVEEQGPHLVTLSAKSADALIARVAQLLQWLNDNPDASIADVCYTTNVSRSQFAYRFAAPARSMEELKSRCAAWLETQRYAAAKPKQTVRAPIAFMFSGQGAQYAGMAAQLYRSHTVFRDALDRCAALARPHLSHDLLDVIFARGLDETLINRTDYTQPALLAVEYALAELLQSFGIVPDAVIGHSLGEIAAACVAKAMTIDDAMRLAIARGALMHGLPAGGAMIAIMAPEREVRPLIEAVSPGIEIAAMNGPLNTVVSGDREALQALTAALDKRALNYRELRISNGFHSARTEPILDQIEAVAADIAHSAPVLPLISNITGARLSDAPDRTYWRRHLREAVRFGDGMIALSELGCATYLEVGPHPVLLPMAQACLQAAGKSAEWLAMLVRKQSDADSLTDMLAGLYLAGHKLDWEAIHAGSPRRRLSLPTYPFQRKRHWLDIAPPAHMRPQIAQTAPTPPIAPDHPLLGQRIAGASGGLTFETRYGVQHLPYLSDHRVTGTMVLPTTVELEAALAAGRRFFGADRVSIESAMHHEAMAFADGKDHAVRISVHPLGSGRAHFKIASAAAGSDDWRTHMTGTVSEGAGAVAPASSLDELRARCPHPVPVADLYDRLAALGLEYGPCFRGVREVYAGRNEVLTQVALPAGMAGGGYILHPAFLDACLHAYPLVIDQADARGDDGARHSILPVSLQGYRCHQDGASRAFVHTRLRGVANDGTQLLDIGVYDAAGRPVATLEGLGVRRLRLDAVTASQSEAEPEFYQVAWRKRARAKPAIGQGDAPASFIVFADVKGIGAALATRMEAAGHHCHLVYRGDALVRQGPRTWTVNERDPQAFRALLEQVSSAEALACNGVVYLWALDAPSVSALTLEKLRNASETMSRGALAILHALSERRQIAGGRPRLWLVTADSQSLDADRPADPVQAPLWGLGRTIAIEHPSIWGGLIDLHMDGRWPDIDALMNELVQPDGETQIALSARGERHVARFVRKPLAASPERMPRVRPDCSYLITGGLGMLGRGMAQWLIGKGAKHIVLTGRHANADKIEAIASEAGRTGATLYVVACDISREDEVSRLMRRISDQLPPLRGVVHSAGVLDDGILAQLGWERFAPLFEPRVFGSWLLHQHTRALALDFFIVNSSLLSLLGSAGQANYTASAAFLDALVAHRRAQGLPAMAINWCAWSGGGLATLSGARGEAMWSSLGHAFISPEAGMRAFDQAMHRDLGHIAVAAADWRTYSGKIGNPPFLSELVNISAVVSEPAPRRAEPQRVVEPRRVVAVEAGARQRHLRRLQQHITTKLGFTEPVALDQPLNDLGVDSLMSVTLSNSLESEFGIPVPVAEIINGPTIDQLFAAVFEPHIDVAPSGVTANGHGKPDEVAPLEPTAPQSADRMAPVFAAPPPVLNGGPRSGNGNGAAHGAVLSQDNSRAMVFDHLQRRVMEELGFAEPIEPETKLNEVGLDSLRSVALSNRLEKDFGFPVPVADLIAGPSLNELSETIAASMARSGHEMPLPFAATSLHAEQHDSGGLAAHGDAPPPAVVFEVSGTTGSRGLNIRLGPDVSAEGRELRSGAANGSHHATSGNGAARDPRSQNGAGHTNGGGPIAWLEQPAPAVRTASRNGGQWLIAPKPNPSARARLFCFPYAGGGVASFRGWPQLAHDALEIVAIEPPGRGTRINEPAVEDIDTFVERLMPELTGWLDRPSAFFGHCLGGLTMYATLRELPDSCAHFVKHAFACGIRPPHLLRRRGRFEDNLAFRMMLHQDFDIHAEPYEQKDDLFAEIVRQFDTPEADRMLAIPKLRKLLLPAIRAEFGMAFNYRYRPAPPFRFPIASFVGASDPWVSASDSAAWGELTRSRFTNHVREGSHFLMVDDQDYILDTINRDFVDAALG